MTYQNVGSLTLIEQPLSWLICNDSYEALANIQHNYEDDVDLAILNLMNALEVCETNEWIDDYNRIKENIDLLEMKK